jgi:ABC-type sugar transport system substrate-binding protein
VGGVFHAFAIDPAKVSAVARLVANLQSRGIRVVIVDLPLANDIMSYLPHAQSDVQATALALQEIAAQAGVPFAPTGLWPDTFFADPVHLNGTGAHLLTAGLMPTLVALLGGQALGGQALARVTPIHP